MTDLSARLRRALEKLLNYWDYEPETWKCRAEINGKRGFELQDERDQLKAEVERLAGLLK